ncbi:hypothetical protein HanIR_Chr03g0115631 [Helianthus annuus]|nr:hypothetical protein HanIR_Chr03g0115631 [Helianthus annuus]
MQSMASFSYVDSFIRKLKDCGQSQTNSRPLTLKSSNDFIFDQRD